MNEHPLDFHQEECKNFAEAYMQAETASKRAAAAKMQAATANMQAVTADKHAKIAFGLFKAVCRIYAKGQPVQQQAKFQQQAKKVVAADIRSSLLFQRAERLRWRANAFSKESLAASMYAAQLATSVASSFNTTFSGKKARLL